MYREIFSFSAASHDYITYVELSNPTPLFLKRCKPDLHQQVKTAMNAPGAFHSRKKIKEHFHAYETLQREANRKRKRDASRETSYQGASQRQPGHQGTQGPERSEGKQRAKRTQGTERTQREA